MKISTLTHQYISHEEEKSMNHTPSNIQLYHRILFIEQSTQQTQKFERYVCYNEYKKNHKIN